MNIHDTRNHESKSQVCKQELLNQTTTPSKKLMTLVLSMSHLFPIRILSTLSAACCSMFRIQFRISTHSQTNNRHGCMHDDPWVEKQQQQQQTLERLLISDIVDQQNAHGSSVISCRNRSEPFLSCRVNLLIVLWWVLPFAFPHVRYWPGYLSILTHELVAFTPIYLTCSIPNLKLDAFAIQINCLNFEINTKMCSHFPSWAMWVLTLIAQGI